MRLVRERPNGADAKRYRQIRHNAALYRAAARLWQQGLDMSEAINVEALQKVCGAYLACVEQFSEWSFAAWEFQKEFLEDPEGCAFDVSFLAAYHQDDHNHMTTCKDTLAGKAMTQWWDRSEEAGPTTRPASRFEEAPPSLEVLAIVDDEIPDLLQEKYKSIQAGALKDFEDSIKQELKISNALKGFRDGSTGQGSTTGPRPNPTRTLAAPDWDGEPPQNFRQVLALTGVPLSDFESNNTLLFKMMNI
eukprot:s1345_g9.t1